MYRIYTSEAYVLESTPTGEYDRTVTLFTSQYGLVRAIARSVRKEGAKMRSALTLHTRVQVSLVKGREVWRIVGATSIATKRGSGHSIVARVSRLLVRLLPPHTPERALFNMFASFEMMAFDESIDRRTLSILAALHILRSCGYLGAHTVFDNILEKPVGQETLAALVLHSKEALVVINDALKESHL